MAVLFVSDGYKSERWSEVGRTDTVANSLAPEFRKPLRATYQVGGWGACPRPCTSFMCERPCWKAVARQQGM